jgi:spore coat protein U-like protein
MRGVRWLVLPAVLGAMLVMGEGSASAQTCTLAVTPVAFGIYNVFSTTSLSSTGSVTCQCTPRTAMSITVWISKGSGTTNNPRQMASGANQLNYYLCQDASCNKLWGDKQYPSDSGPITPPLSGTVSLAIYGVITAGQDVPVGTYADTALVEVDF